MRFTHACLVAGMILIISGCATDPQLREVRVEITGSVSVIDSVTLSVTTQGEEYFGQGAATVELPWSHKTYCWTGNYVTVSAYPLEGDLMDGDVLRISIYVDDRLHVYRETSYVNSVQIYRQRIL